MASLAELGAICKAGFWDPSWGDKPEGFDAATPKQQQKMIAVNRRSSKPTSIPIKEHSSAVRESKKVGESIGRQQMRNRYKPNMLGRWAGRRTTWKGKTAGLAALGAAGYAASPWRKKEQKWNDRKGVSHAGREAHAQSVDRRTARGALAGAGIASAGYAGASYGLNSFGAQSKKRWSPAVDPKTGKNTWTDEVNRHKQNVGYETDPANRPAKGDSKAVRRTKNAAAKRLRHKQLPTLNHAYRTMPSHIPGSNVTRAGARLYGAGTIGRRAGLVGLGGAIAGGLYARGRGANKYNKNRPPRNERYPYKQLQRYKS